MFSTPLELTENNARLECSSNEDMPKFLCILYTMFKKEKDCENHNPFGYLAIYFFKKPIENA